MKCPGCGRDHEAEAQVASDNVDLAVMLVGAGLGDLAVDILGDVAQTYGPLTLAAALAARVCALRARAAGVALDDPDVLFRPVVNGDPDVAPYQLCDFCLAAVAMTAAIGNDDYPLFTDTFAAFDDHDQDRVLSALFALACGRPVYCNHKEAADGQP